MEVKQIKKIIHDINSKLRNYIEENSLNNKIQDIISEFYIEFLKYSNSDKSLGIVLTPSHITELFCELSNLDENDVVIDNCTGTSGFLISAMGRMMKKSKGDIEKIKNIKSKQLLGIEKEGTIYTLAVSNMYLHGDGKSNIFKGDCFDEKIKLEIKEKFLPTVGFLNPPYKSKKNAREEMEFILNNLEFLQKGGRCVAIIPMSCVLASSGKGFELKEKLLKKHTLKAVLSMPDELFINSKVGVVTAILVIEAHNPHPKNFKTFFGYFKDDGFVKRKNKGRNDHLDKWKDIKEKWLNLYVNNEIEPGLSTTKIITAKEEWCAEAYLETNYTELTQDEFEQTLRDYLAYLVKIGDLDEND
nr:N-6 DNA methylase [Sebaldella sp. S0638]